MQGPTLPYTIQYHSCCVPELRWSERLNCHFYFHRLGWEMIKIQVFVQRNCSTFYCCAVWSITTKKTQKKNINVLLFSFFDKCNGRGTYYRHVDWFKFCKWFPILLDWREKKEIHHFRCKSTLHNFCSDIQYMSYVLHH